MQSAIFLETVGTLATIFIFPGRLKYKK